MNQHLMTYFIYESVGCDSMRGDVRVVVLSFLFSTNEVAQVSRTNGAREDYNTRNAKLIL